MQTETFVEEKNFFTIECVFRKASNRFIFLEMRVDIMYPGEPNVLPTSTHQYVAVSGSSRKYAEKRARIFLEFEDGSHVPCYNEECTLPDVLSGSDYKDGVLIDTEGCATFKVRIAALSSQHKNRKFRFRIDVDLDKEKESIYTLPFRTISKMSRKRKAPGISTDEQSIGEYSSDFQDVYSAYMELKEKYMQMEALHSDIMTLFLNMGTQLAEVGLSRTATSSSPSIGNSSDTEENGYTEENLSTLLTSDELEETLSSSATECTMSQ